jgi:D-3-phosphoglycerate dehydrogenase
MPPFKVVVADPPGADCDVEQAAFAASGLDLDTRYLGTRDVDRVLAEAADADALVVSWVHLTRPAIARLDRCKLVVRYGIGVDMIDLDAATDHGILVCNTSQYCLDEVSNHALGLLLMLNRQLLADADSLRSGGWYRTGAPPPRRLSGQCLGLVGLGNIGRLVARKARAFGLEVIAYDPYLQEQQAQVDGIPLVALDDLMRNSDYVSVHCPLNNSTRHLLGQRELALLRPTAYLINTARGPIVDQPALLEALSARAIAGAALDVFEEEPLPVDHPLRALDNVVLTPHSASVSVESAIDCRRAAIEHVVTYLRGGVPTDLVNRAVLDRHAALAARSRE